MGIDNAEEYFDAGANEYRIFILSKQLLPAFSTDF